jgi:short-subunit dehydrogenase
MTDVNKFPMPFLLQTEDAAKKMVKAIDKGKKTFILPWQVKMIIKLTRWLPTPIYYKIFF